MYGETGLFNCRDALVIRDVMKRPKSNNANDEVKKETHGMKAIPSNVRVEASSKCPNRRKVLGMTISSPYTGIWEHPRQRSRPCKGFPANFKKGHV